MTIEILTPCFAEFLEWMLLFYQAKKKQRKKCQQEQLVIFILRLSESRNLSLPSAVPIYTHLCRAQIFYAQDSSQLTGE